MSPSHQNRKSSSTKRGRHGYLCSCSRCMANAALKTTRTPTVRAGNLAGRPERYCCSIILDNWALPVSPTCHPNGQGSVRCLAFRRTDPAFEPSLYQGQLPPSGNAIFQGRDKDLKTVPAIQSADCRDKMRAQIAANSGRFALNWEISVCAGLRGGAGRTRTSNQTIISSWLGKCPKCRGLRYERFVSPIELQ